MLGKNIVVMQVTVYSSLQRRLRLVQGTIRLCFRSGQRPVRIFACRGTVSFISTFRGGKGFSVILLSVYVPNLLKASVTTRVQGRGDHTRVIFLSADRRFTIRTFTIQTTRCLIGPFARRTFTRTVSQIVSDLHRHRDNGVIFHLINNNVRIRRVGTVLCVRDRNRVRGICATSRSILRAQRPLTTVLSVLRSVTPNRFMSPKGNCIIGRSTVHLVGDRCVRVRKRGVPLTGQGCHRFRRSCLGFVFKRST